MEKFVSLFVAVFCITVCFGSLTVSADTEIVISSQNPGNIFSDDEKIELSVVVNGYIAGLTARYTVKSDDTNETMWSLSENAVTQKRIALSNLKNGGYSLLVELINQNGEIVKTAKTVFSRVMSGKHNNAFQLQGHFDAYKYTLEEQMMLIDKVNAGGYRDHPVGWLEYAHNNDSCEGIEYLNRVNTESLKYDFSSNISIPHLGCIKYTGGKDIPPTDDTALVEFGKYCVGLLRATGARKAEIWNEPNMNSLMTPSVYVNIVEAAASAIKDYDENISVGAVSLANPNNMCLLGKIFGVKNCNDTSFEHYKSYGKCYFNDLIENGLLDTEIDAITIHSYHTDIYEMPKQIKYYRDLLDSLGRNDIKIWITEYGWYTGESETAVSEIDQANIMVKEYLQVMAGGYAESMSVYNLTNKYDLSAEPPVRNSENAEHNFGIVQAQLDELSETGVALSAKKSYIALSAMNSLLADAKGKGAVHFPDEKGKIAACDFVHSDGEDITAFFADTTMPAVIECNADSLIVYDFYGNAKTLYSENGKFGIQLDGNVTYVKGMLGNYKIEKASYIEIIDNYAEIMSTTPQSGKVLIGQYTEDELKGVEIFDVSVSANIPYKVQYSKIPGKLVNANAEIIKHKIPNYDTGNGSYENPYLIGTYDELLTFRNKVNNGETSACAMLVSDIDLNNAQWNPIGTETNKYCGVFDGNGYEITELNGKGNQWGFFGYTNGGEIKNLTLKAGNEGNLSLGHQSAMLIAIASGDTKVTKCAGYGNLNSYGYVGGITCQGECSVKDSYFVGNINGLSWVSGMGYNAKAENCFVYGDIIADINAFKVSNGSAVNCYYLSSNGKEGTGGYGTQKNEEAFSSGELAYILGETFGQKLGNDQYPQFLSENNKVIIEEIGKIKAYFWRDLITMIPLLESL